MPSDAGDFRFPKEYRITSQLEYDKYFEFAEIKTGKIIVLRYYIDNEKITRLGISISKKGKNSVFVNKLKRLIREVFRKNRFRIIDNLQVIISFRKTVTPGIKYSEVEEDFLKILKNLNMLKG